LFFIVLTNAFFAKAAIPVSPAMDRVVTPSLVAPPVESPVEPGPGYLSLEQISQMSVEELEKHFGIKPSPGTRFFLKNIQGYLRANVAHGKRQMETNTHKNKADKEECDIIYMQNGKEISCRIVEVGADEIKYKPCNDPNGFTTTVAKKDVKAYKNGRTGEMSFVENNGDRDKKQKEVAQSNNFDGFAITSFVLALLSLLGIYLPLAPLFISLLAIIFGAVGLGRTRKRGTKGGWMAIFGIVVGALAILTAIILLLFVFSLFML
jgi:hypothetical protein